MKTFIAKIFGQRTNKHPIELKNIQTVLLKPIGDAVGDAIIHTAHLRQIKEANPSIKLGVLVTQRNKPIYQNAGFIDAVLEDKFTTYLSERHKWDLYLDFMPSFTTRSLILDYLLAPKRVINFGKRYKKHYNLDTVKNYDFSTAIAENTHIKDYLNQSVLKNYINPHVNYTVPFSSQHSETVNAFWNKDKSLKILLNPQGSKTEIPPLELKALLTYIHPEYLENIDFLMTHTTGSQDYLDRLNFEVKLSPKTTLLEYFALVNSADIVISVDGGGIHVACACAKPLLAFYANNPPITNMWAPVAKEGIDTLLLLGKTPSTSASDTYGFDLSLGANWLNAQINKQLK